MKSFLRYSKNRFLYNLLKFIVIGILVYLGFSYFSFLNVYALTPTIDKQAYYYHGNMTTESNEFCIVSNSNKTCSPSESVGLSPWLIGTDLSFYSQINSGYFSGSAVIYLHTVSNGNVNFYNRNITSSNVHIGISSSEFPSNGSNVSNVQITNFSIKNIQNTDTGGLAGTNYISKVTFDFKAYTSLQGGYYFNIGVGAITGSDGLFQQLSGEAYNDAMFLFSATTSGTYVSRITLDSGNLNDQKLDNLTEQQQKTNEKLDQTNDKLNGINDNLTDSNTKGATDDADNFFSGFSTDTYGLTSIITSPLTLIGNITSSTCSPLGIPLPYVNSSLTLPCMSDIYEDHFGAFLSIYQMITFGIVAYWVSVRVFNLVKDFKNPDHDEVEVMDL